MRSSPAVTSSVSRDWVSERDGRAVLRDITFTVREHEIFAIAGVDGNGQNELVEAIVGLAQPSDGSVWFLGSTEHWDPRAFMTRGGGVVPADRHEFGVALSLSLEDNLMMTSFDAPRYSRHGLLRKKEIDRECTALIGDFRIRTPSGDVLLQQLSGGNQQRAILAREMSRRPRLMVAAQPTRGLDVSAIEFVHSLLLEHRREGGAIVLVSTELNEVLALGDRIGVMVDGQMRGILPSADANPEVLGLLMAGAGAPG